VKVAFHKIFVKGKPGGNVASAQHDWQHEIDDEPLAGMFHLKRRRAIVPNRSAGLDLHRTDTVAVREVAHLLGIPR
jgi:hypothetical protein